VAPLSTRDPFISADAARAAEGSGRVSAHMERCLAGVLTCPGKTAAELAAATGIDRRAASRRLPELRTAGLVVNPEDLR
jgi:hypothetical protein